MKNFKKSLSLLMCMLMVLSIVPMSVFAAEATEIDTIHVEGVPAPLYGQTVEEYYTAILDERGGGTLTVNDETFNKSVGNYGNLFDEGLEVKKNDTVLSSTSTELITEGNYYVAITLYPANGYVIPADVAVTVDGAVSAEKDFDEYGSLIVYAKYEVKATKIDTVNLTYDLDYIDLNTFYNEYSVTDRARKALATDTAGIKIGYGNCCVSYIDSHGNYYNCTYSSKEIIAEKDYYIRAVLMLEDGYDWPTAAKTDEPSGLKIISNGTDISDTVHIKYRSDLNWIIVYAKIGKPSTEPVIGSVSISDSAIMLDKGESHSFIVDVYGNADDKTVTWTVEGAVSANTTVDSMGKLTIGADETADEITVKATSNYNIKKFVVAKVKIGTPTEIDTVQVEGVPAPLYGQTIKSYYEAIEAKITDGTITVNDEVYDSTAYKYGNLLDDGWNVRSEADGLLSSTSTDLIKEGTYYVAMWFYPDDGYVIPEDVNVIFDGAKSVKIELDEDGCLDIRAEFEVKCPHAYDNDCDAECNLCTEIRTAPHTYDNACDAECNLCNAPRTAPHTYDNACDGQCNNCPATRTPAAHTGGTATCTEKAKCSVCGEAYGSVNKDNHKSITTLKAVAATYKAEGKTEGKKCTACGEITVAQQTVAKKTLAKVEGLKVKTVKLGTGTKTSLTLAWTKVADAEKYEVQQYVNKKWKTVKTTKKASLTVKKLKANKSYKFRVRAIRSDAEGAYTTLTAKTVPLKTTLTLKSGSKRLTASWKTVANINGYEVAYSTAKKFTKKTTKTVVIKKAKTKKTTIKSLKKGKKYFVRVRAYKTVGGKNIYSAWSAVKNVKVK